jgi:RimJ/RimL family protein N-acetyltransferase
MLRGEHICLRTLDAADAEAMRRLRNSPEISSQFQSRHFINDVAQKNFMNALSTSHESLYFVAETISDCSVFGYFFIRNIDHRNQKGENGVFLVPRGIGAGLEAFEATFLLLQYEFQYLNLHKVYAEVLASNNRAIRFNESLGMKREGVRLSHVFFDGRFHDVVQFALFREDFELRPSPIMRSFQLKSQG